MQRSLRARYSAAASTCSEAPKHPTAKPALTYVALRHIVRRHMGKRDPEALLPLTPAMFHVLVALADGETHGYQILKDVEELTGGVVRLSTGTLYGIIKRLLSDGLIRESASVDKD